MLKVDPRYVTAARRASTGSELHELLELAIRLEHATIPPYLAAAYSLTSGSNESLRSGVLEIALEEMLHMAIAGNVLNAIGGKPSIDSPAFVPSYPAPLPMNVGDGVVVGIRRFSKELVKDVFMRIEEPELPLRFPAKPSLEEAGHEFATIGTFYRAVIEAITNLGDEIFTGEKGRQVVSQAGFPSDALFAVTDVGSAVRALDRIIKDGEGTAAVPFDDGGELAHYYRFEELVHGRRLVQDTSVEQGYAFAGLEIPFDQEGVSDFIDDPKAANHAEGSPERQAIDAFNRTYSELLRILQRAFDGNPTEIRSCRRAMARLGVAATALIEMEDPNTGGRLGPPFEYVPVA